MGIMELTEGEMAEASSYAEQISKMHSALMCSAGAEFRSIKRHLNAMKASIPGRIKHWMYLNGFFKEERPALSLCFAQG